LKKKNSKRKKKGLLTLTFEWWLKLVKATVDVFGHFERVVDARAGGEDDY
jgi:hypothetical protein